MGDREWDRERDRDWGSHRTAGRHDSGRYDSYRHEDDGRRRSDDRPGARSPRGSFDDARKASGRRSPPPGPSSGRRSPPTAPAAFGAFSMFSKNDASKAPRAPSKVPGAPPRTPSTKQQLDGKSNRRVEDVNVKLKPPNPGPMQISPNSPVDSNGEATEPNPQSANDAMVDPMDLDSDSSHSEQTRTQPRPIASSDRAPPWEDR